MTEEPVPVPDFVPPPTGKPIVFYIPHQDDETLFLAQVIAHHALAGRAVHVVLCTNGSTSGVLAELNGTATDPTWWGGMHFPEREGYEPLTKDEFGLARTREWRTAVAQLGVFPENVHFGPAPGLTSSVELPDNCSHTYATLIMRSWAEWFLDPAHGGWQQVGHYTTHWNPEINTDHANLGQALLDLRGDHSDWFGDVRWSVRPENFTDVPGAYTYNPPPNLTTQIKVMQRRATYGYRAWAPQGGMFAVGYHSVGQPYFNGAETGVANKMFRLV